MTTKLDDFNKTRAAFMERVSARDIPAQALKLAYLIAFKYMNRETRDARPSQGTLANDLDVTTRTVRTLLDILQPRGLVVVPGHGPNRASTYRLEGQATPMSPIEADNTTPVSPIMTTEKRKPASSYKRKPVSSLKSNSGNLAQNSGNLAHDKRKSGARIPETSFHPTNKKNQEEEPRKKNQGDISRAQARESDHANLFDGNDRSGRRPRKQRRVNGHQQAEGFDEFYAAYPRHAARGAAEKAYARIVGNGEATPAELLAGAKRYADERSGQEPKFTKHPATWLSKQCWLDEPAARPETPAERIKRQSGLLGNFDEGDGQ